MKQRHLQIRGDGRGDKVDAVAARLLAIARALPEGATVSLGAAQLNDLAATSDAEARWQPQLLEEPAPVAESSRSWRERIWMVNEDMLLTAAETAEAIGKSRDQVYRMAKAGRLSHRRLDGGLAFPAGELRAWLKRK